jgi:hypothetical protein
VTQSPEENASPAFLARAYAVVAALAILPSLRVWFQAPMEITRWEFDYFMGLFAGVPPGQWLAYLLAGRLTFFLVFLLAGLLFWALASRLEREPGALPGASLRRYGGVLLAIFLSGVPFLNVDVFFYIGKGWLESHYALSPYAAAMTQVPSFEAEEMFHNVYPPFREHADSNYGPAFFKLAAVLTRLSAGSEKAALFLFKVASLGLHLLCGVLVARLVDPGRRRFAFFVYVLNPVSLYSFVTAAHNDVLMNVFVLVALVALRQDHGLAAGLSLGSAAAVKYVPLAFLPFFVAALFPWNREQLRVRGLEPVLRLALGFSVAFVTWHLAYPEGFHGLFAVGRVGTGSIRSSILHVVFFVHLLVARVDAGALQAVLNGAFVVAYGAISVRFVLNRRKGRAAFSLEEACVLVVLAYFLLASRSNHEWYLSWLLGFAVVAADPAYSAFAVRLTSVYMPLTVFTVNNPMTVAWASNAAEYLVLVACSVPLLRHLWRRRVDDPSPARLLA